jgi:hypothetical protein
MGPKNSAQKKYGRFMSTSKQTTNKPRQAQGSKQPFDPNGLPSALACSQGISGVQVPFSLHLTTSNAPVRDDAITVQTTSALVGRYT